MPRYVYFDHHTEDGLIERVTSIAARDEQACDVEGCEEPLKRKMNVFTGSVWSPTRNGGMS